MKIYWACEALWVVEVLIYSNHRLLSCMSSAESLLTCDQSTIMQATLVHSRSYFLSYYSTRHARTRQGQRSSVNNVKFEDPTADLTKYTRFYEIYYSLFTSLLCTLTSQIRREPLLLTEHFRINF